MSKKLDGTIILLGDEPRWQLSFEGQEQQELEAHEELRLPPGDWPKGTEIRIYVPEEAYKEE